MIYLVRSKREKWGEGQVDNNLRRNGAKSINEQARVLEPSVSTHFCPAHTCTRKLLFFWAMGVNAGRERGRGLKERKEAGKEDMLTLTDHAEPAYWMLRFTKSFQSGSENDR